MPEMPEAAPIPDRPPLHLKGGYLAIAGPPSIAEACFSIPAVRAIKNGRPQGTLVIVSPESIAELWETVTEVDKVISYPDSASHRKIAALLSESDIPFDSSIAWEDSPAAVAMAKAGIKQRLGMSSKNLDKSLTDPVEIVEKAGPIQHRVRHYMLFVEKLGIDGFLAKNFKNPDRPDQPTPPRVALVPGSDFGPSAEWSIERYAVLAQAIIDNGSHELHIIPSPGRPSPALTLAKHFAQQAHLFEGNLTEKIELLSTCEAQALIGNDGSVPHLASYVDTESVVIFGPNEPAWKRPLGKIHHTLREQVPCSPCLLDKCPLDHRCMNEISVEHVLAALE